MNHPIHWLYSQHGGAQSETSLRCYLCGAWSAQERYPVAKGIADTFNSHFLAKAPSSPWLCAACHWYFNDKSHPDFRKMSLIVAEQRWHNWQRTDMKTEIGIWLSAGLEADAYLVCSLSKKKHILLQAPLNTAGAKMLAVQVEEQIAYLDYSAWEYLDRRFMALLALGHNKGEILSSNLYGNTLRKHGRIDDALRFSAELEPYRNSAALDLLSYVTIIDKESEETLDASNTRRTAATPEHGSGSAVGGLDADRRRIQSAVPHGHLDAVRDQHSGRRPHDDEPGPVSQPSLW